MIAERRRIADRFRSEGEGEAMRIRGEKDRDLLEIRSEAYRTAEEIRGRADASATGDLRGRLRAQHPDQGVLRIPQDPGDLPGRLRRQDHLGAVVGREFYRYLTDLQGR